MNRKPKKPIKFTPAVRRKFLAQLAETGRLAHAAAFVGLSTAYFYDLKKLDDIFAADFENAMDMYRASLEAEIHRRAVEGVVEKKYHQGLPILDYELDDQGQVKLDKDGRPKIVGQAFVRRYSDSLLLAQARRHIPEYNEKRQVDMKVTGLEGILDELRPSTGLPSESDNFGASNKTKH